MKTRTQTTKIFFIALSLFILGCILVSPKTFVDPTTAEAGTPIPSLAELATATLPPIDTPTATVYPPVFNPEVLGDNRVLDSFILTRKEKSTGCGYASEVDRTDTIGYIKEPFSGYEVKNFLVVGDEFAEHNKYLVGGRFYETNGSVDWVIYLEADPGDIDYLQREADMREGRIRNVGILSAQFVGQEEYQGIPAYHFTLDQTNLRESSDPTGAYKIEAAQGDIYLSQGANYLLHFYIKVSGNVCSYGPDYFPGVSEFTQELSSINQLTEIAVPPEYLEPEQTLLSFDLPLPAGSSLIGMRRFGEIRVDNYFFAASVSNDEFLAFYKNLAPTNGWTVSHIGHVTYHYPCSEESPGDQICVIINKGDVQFILYYEGGITADYDWGHVYSPQ